MKKRTLCFASLIALMLGAPIIAQAQDMVIDPKTGELVPAKTTKKPKKPAKTDTSADKAKEQADASSTNTPATDSAGRKIISGGDETASENANTAQSNQPNGSNGNNTVYMVVNPSNGAVIPANQPNGTQGNNVVYIVVDPSTGKPASANQTTETANSNTETASSSTPNQPVKDAGAQTDSVAIQPPTSTGVRIASEIGLSFAFSEIASLSSLATYKFSKKTIDGYIYKGYQRGKDFDIAVALSNTLTVPAAGGGAHLAGYLTDSKAKAWTPYVGAAAGSLLGLGLTYVVNEASKIARPYAPLLITPILAMAGAVTAIEISHGIHKNDAENTASNSVLIIPVITNSDDYKGAGIQVIF